jgi:cytoskeletal protein CcmA (bactofilin family)
MPVSVFDGKDKPRTSTSLSPAAGPTSSTKLETVIGPNANFRGAIQSDGGLRVDGIFQGDIQLAGNLVVGETGKVMADIKVQNVSVSGMVKGTINTTGRLEILSTGKVWADISVASLLIDEGGYYRGQSMMPGESDLPVLEAPGRKVDAPARS